MRTWITKNGVMIYGLSSIRCNCYVIHMGDSFILVDTSVKSERKLLQMQLKKLGIKKLEAIIITHVHTDHVENASFFENKFQCPVYVHQSEFHYLQQGHCKMPKGTILFTKIVERVVNRFDIFNNFDPCLNIEPVAIMKLGNNLSQYIQILETPGHSEGSVSIIVDQEIALVGDAMVHTRRGKIYPPFADRESELVHSWKKLLTTGCKLFLPAHGKENKRNLLVKEYKLIHESN